MQTYTAKYGENCVYQDQLSVQFIDVFCKYVWFQHVFYLPFKKNKMFIPANGNGWKWILDDKGLSLNSSSVKLIGKEDTKSYLAVHYNTQDPAPYPMTLGLNIPEFLGNYVSISYEDKGCRVKSVVHDVMQPLFIDDLKINITGLTNRTIELNIEEIV